MKKKIDSAQNKRIKHADSADYADATANKHPRNLRYQRETK